MGTLYLVSTPIGNLEDLSPRARRVLGEADGVLAEDTRRTGALLRHLGIGTSLISLHAHNEEARSREVLSRLEGGATLALVSDAGTPLVSDPGERLVQRAIAAGVTIIPVPGPSAVLHALVGSGFPTATFAFLGFPPRRGKARTDFLTRVAESGETVVLFESPERTAALIQDLEAACGPERRAVVGRELTKLHEEFRRGTLGELSAYYREGDAPRGEVTVVLSPAEDGGGRDVVIDVEAGRILAEALLRQGESPSRAARDLARRLGIPRNRAYELVQGVTGAAESEAPPFRVRLEGEGDRTEEER